MELNDFDEIGNLGHLEENDFIDISELETDNESEFLNSDDEPQPDGGFNMSLSYIDPALAVNLADTIIVAGAVYLFSMLKKRVTKAQLKMSEAEKRNIEPIVKACLESVNFNVSNPWQALAMSLGFIYGSKVVMIYAEDRQSAPDFSELVTEAQQPKRGRGRPRKFS